MASVLSSRHRRGPQKYIRLFWNAILTQRFSPVSIRDAGHQESALLQPGNPLKGSVVGVEALPSVNSDLVFLFQDWSVGARL